MDAGATAPTSGWVLGVAETTAAGNATFTLVTPAGYNAAAGGGLSTLDGVSAINTTPSTLTNGTFTAMQFDTQTGAAGAWTNGSGASIHSTSSNKQNFVAISGGIWNVACSINYTLTTIGALAINVGATTVWYSSLTTSGANPGVNVGGPLKLATNDIVTCLAFNNSGGNSTSYTATMSMVKVGN